ncbi:MAG: hypothetical protein HC942_28425, partial [Microcoleus sp. SU_5_6]|nr:hypothetical protein [Microcoleus sp. SU_5_6]
EYGATTEAAAATKTQQEDLQQTIHLLQTIIKNVVVHHPRDEKYHWLKLSNAKMKRYIVDSDSSWGAMEMLTMVGFVQKTITTSTTGTDHDDDDADQKGECVLVMATPTPQAARDIGQYALQLLDILQNRASAQFVAELAPPTPWQAPPPLTAVRNYENEQEEEDDAVSATPGQQQQPYRAGGFVTPEERWARAERVAQSRRSGRGRMPAPGEAPSSRGKWGR